MLRAFVAAILVLFVAASAAAKVVYVNQAATGNDDGTSWQDAFVDLQDGLAAAQAGDEIWVADGTYSPGPARTDTFQLKSSVALYGGFAGVETLRAQRDVANNLTTLTGSDNAYHVCTGSGATGALLDGFVVANGSAGGSGNDTGAGLLDASAVVIRHCTFRNNVAASSGGAVMSGSVVEDSIFEDNTSYGGGGAIDGGSTITRCIFRNNGTAYSSGGAINVGLAASCVISNCQFVANHAIAGGALCCTSASVIGSTFVGNGAAHLYNGFGGAAYLQGTFVGCSFVGNWAYSEGGAIYSSSAVVVNCTFSKNSVDGGGGALSAGSLQLSNSTFSGNQAYLGSVLYAWQGSSSLSNSILWGNGGSSIFVATGAAVTIEYTDCEGGCPGTGNLGVDPEFVDAAGGNLHVLPSSPCIDAGDNASLPPDTLDLDGDGDTAEPIPYDLDGRPRVWNGTADMGAYEYTPFRPLDYLVGEGLGQPNRDRVKVYDGAGRATSVDFYAYGAGKWGVNVASGDIDGGATGEILTGPGQGAVYGPTVRAFRRDGTAIAKVNFYAYGTLKHGVNVAAGELDNDGYTEILTGAGPGTVFGPHVRGFNFDNASVSSIAKISFFSYATLKYGVNVGSGDLDGDGFAEILTGPGPSPAFAPLVRAFNYDNVTVAAVAKINFWPFTVLQYGVVDQGGDVDADGFAEIAAAPGPGPGASFPSRFLGFDYDNASIAPLPGFDVTAFAGTSYGGRLGLGDVNADGRADLLCAAGPDPAADSTIKGYWYDGAKLPSLLGTFTPFGAAAYGATVAAADLGY